MKSLAELEAMACGVVPIVNVRSGWFTGLLDNATVELDNREDLPITLKDTGDYKIAKMSVAAFEHAKNQHSQKAYDEAFRSRL